jgi:cell division protein FtsW (lipid II flippase)
VSSSAMREREEKAGREFAFTLAGAFLVVGLLALRKARHFAATVSFALALILLLAGLIVPGRLGPLRRAWMRIGEVIGGLTTPVLMAAMYYLVLTPIASVRRVRRRGRSLHRAGWYHREPLPPPSRMERQF